MAGVVAVNLTKRYGTRAAIDGITLTVRDASFVAVMGPSGSGKSTLLHLLGGLDTPTAGTVRLGDQDLSEMDERQRTLVRRRQVGIVFQAFNLVPVLSAEENVALPLIIDRRPGREASEAAQRALASVGLTDRAGALPSELSGGEQQRVAIARAIVHGPSLILADEPTGNLDSATGLAVMSVLREHHHVAGCTMVVVTHDPNVASFADEIVHLHDGRASGTLNLRDHAETARLETVVNWLAAPVA